MQLQSQFTMMGNSITVNQSQTEAKICDQLQAWQKKFCRVVFWLMTEKSYKSYMFVLIDYVRSYCNRQWQHIAAVDQNSHFDSQ